MTDKDDIKKKQKVAKKAQIEFNNHREMQKWPQNTWN